jgi:hypothetical protein
VARLTTDYYTLLLRILHDLGKRSKTSFHLAGKTSPAIPVWGDEEDISDAYLPNSYEIAAVCFRVEVENYLWLLNKYYDFAEDKPQERDLETINAANEFALSARPDENSFISKASASTIYPLRQASAVRFTSPAPIVGLPRNNRRMGEVLNPLASTFELARDYPRGNVPVEPEEAEQMRRMTPQGEFRERDLPPHLTDHHYRRTEFPPFRRGQHGAPPAGDPDDGDDHDDDDLPDRTPRRSAPFRLPGERDNTGGAVRPSSEPASSKFGGPTRSFLVKILVCV